MIFDIIVIAILALAIFRGYRSGFVYTCIHTVGWIVSVLLGFLWAPKVKEYLADNTDIYTHIHESLSEKFAEMTESSADAFTSLPSVLQEIFMDTADTAALSFAEAMANTAFSIIAFILVVLAVKLVLWLILEVLSKKHTGGLTGAVDGLLGIAFGFIRGLLFVFLFFALLVPALEFMSPETVTTATSSLAESKIANDLYNNNLLLMIIRDLMAV